MTYFTEISAILDNYRDNPKSLPSDFPTVHDLFEYIEFRWKLNSAHCSPVCPGRALWLQLSSYVTHPPTIPWIVKEERQEFYPNGDIAVFNYDEEGKLLDVVVRGPKGRCVYRASRSSDPNVDEID